MAVGGLDLPHMPWGIHLFAHVQGVTHYEGDKTWNLNLGVYRVRGGDEMCRSEAKQWMFSRSPGFSHSKLSNASGENGPPPR